MDIFFSYKIINFGKNINDRPIDSETIQRHNFVVINIIHPFIHVMVVIVKTTIEAQLFKITSNSKPPTDTGHIHNHQKWLPYQIVSVKTVKKIDPQTTEIWPIKLNVP